MCPGASCHLQGSYEMTIIPHDTSSPFMPTPHSERIQQLPRESLPLCPGASWYLRGSHEITTVPRQHGPAFHASATILRNPLAPEGAHATHIKGLPINSRDLPRPKLSFMAFLLCPQHIQKGFNSLQRSPHHMCPESSWHLRGSHKAKIVPRRYLLSFHANSTST